MWPLLRVGPCHSLTFANCCTRVATVEFRNPYLMPQTSATARPNFSWVLSPSSTTFHIGRTTFSCSGTIVLTVLYRSETLVRLSFPRENGLVEGGTQVYGIDTPDWEMTLARSVERRWREAR